MRSKVYATVRRPSIRPTVCPIRPPHAAAAGLLLWTRRAGDVDRLLPGGQQQPRPQHGAQQQVRAVTRCQLT